MHLERTWRFFVARRLLCSCWQFLPKAAKPSTTEPPLSKFYNHFFVNGKCKWVYLYTVITKKKRQLHDLFPIFSIWNHVKAHSLSWRHFQFLTIWKKGSTPPVTSPPFLFGYVDARWTLCQLRGPAFPRYKPTSSVPLESCEATSLCASSLAAQHWSDQAMSTSRRCQTSNVTTQLHGLLRLHYVIFYGDYSGLASFLRKKS